MSTSILVSNGVTYIGESTVISGGSGGPYNAVRGFIDQGTPTPGKSEWGMDTMSVTMKGIQPNFVAFVAGLAQGQTRGFNGNTFYLQTWEPDNLPIFPSVVLHYKGLVGGIPPVKADGQAIEASITLSAGSVSGYQSATREIRYFTRSTKTKYIATSRPTSASNGLDVSFTPIIYYSVIRATDTAGNNYVFNGANAPAALVTALTPAAAVQGLPECSPVVGSTFFECTDSATNLYQGS